MRAVRVMMAGVVMAVAACGGGGDDGGGTTAPAVFTTLAVDPANPTIIVGGTQTLTASVRRQLRREVLHLRGEMGLLGRRGHVGGAGLHPAQTLCRAFGPFPGIDLFADGHGV